MAFSPVYLGESTQIVGKITKPSDVSAYSITGVKVTIATADGTTIVDDATATADAPEVYYQDDFTAANGYASDTYYTVEFTVTMSYEGNTFVEKLEDTLHVKPSITP